MLPLSVRDLEGFLPHREPAVWIHEVINADETSGTCTVRFSRTATFADTSSVLESSYLEWMAQAFGFVSAAQRKLGLLKTQSDLEQAFLAAVKNYQILEVPQSLEEGDLFQVNVRATHVVGPVTLVEGKIEKDSKTLATAQLKLFAVPKA